MKAKRKSKANAVREIKFSTRMNEKERNTLNRKARKAKMNPSAYVRQLILA